MKKTWQVWWRIAVWLLGVGSLSVGAQVVPVPADTLPGRNGDTAADVVVRADYVTVLTSVNSTTGLPVQNLSDTDFEIYEDGQLQVISRVGRQADQPLRLALLLDISASVRNRLKFEQEAALDFPARAAPPGPGGVLCFQSRCLSASGPDLQPECAGNGRARAGGAGQRRCTMRFSLQRAAWSVNPDGG